MININTFNPKNIKVDKTFSKDNLVYCIKYEKSHKAKSLNTFFNKINGYVKDNYRRKYLALIPVD